MDRVWKENAWFYNKTSENFQTQSGFKHPYDYIMSYRKDINTTEDGEQQMQYKIDLIINKISIEEGKFDDG